VRLGTVRIEHQRKADGQPPWGGVAWDESVSE
jgi:hypothetical protein